MSVSIRKLFEKQGIQNQVISLRDALTNHHEGLQIGLRAAYRRLLLPADGNGFARGCRRKGNGPLGELSWVIPSWVSVHDHETRTIEGVLTKSKITHTDFPLYPWHFYYDWNFFVKVDKQYKYLLSKSDAHRGDIMECEWDSAFIPSWAWPQKGNRIMIIGRWIYDCGHPEDGKHKTEIHPPKAVISFRKEAVKFSGNSGPTRANNAVVFIGRKGGYWNHSINDQNYTFHLYLPPKPFSSAEPKLKVGSKTGALPVQPHAEVFPAEKSRLFRVQIPLKGLTPHPQQYGVIISAGWSDPNGTETAKINRVRVRIKKILMRANLDRVTRDEWYVYVGVNGRWKVWRDIGGESKTLNWNVNLDLHPGDKIHISVCGFEADEIHGEMGNRSGYSWSRISSPTMTHEQMINIREDLAWKLKESLNNQNDKIGVVSKEFVFGQRPAIKNNKYELKYDVELR